MIPAAHAAAAAMAALNQPWALTVMQSFQHAAYEFLVAEYQVAYQS
jgi:hypothetical protein